MRKFLLVFILIAITPITQLFACNLSKEQPNGKVFYLAGLKYETYIKINIDANKKVSGTVKSNEHGLEGETVSFVGTLKKGKIKVKFNGKPPIVGAASEWTNKPWRIKEKEGKKLLIITFYAKNYNTSKWENMDYEFEEISEQKN